jgi:asparagine synthase (glutamine-hydrolysing)
MCAIFGFCSDSVTDLPSRLLERCRDTLRHRGPDTAGSFQDRGLYFGFRRLAILDLSPEGNQPMSSADGRYTLIFNGEIYNFLELRAELQSQRDVFRGRSDTEVLLHLCARQGTHCLERLNGMFAFAIYDKLERTVLLVRDRLGVKPLFYWRQGKTFAFASEVRALRELPRFPRDVNPEALALYFRLGTVPEWTSIYPNVSKLPPGCWMRYRLDTGTTEGPTPYWDLPPVGEEEGKTEQEWIDEIEALLWDATRIRLRSDVPLGVFLSGGIDSGLVAAAASRQAKGLCSLTVGFPGEREDETALALASAQHLGLNPMTRNLDLPEGLEALPRIMAHFDEPFSDTSALPTSMVCKEARRNFTVVLSGDAGDEAFGGYANHVRAWKWRHLESLSRGCRQASGSLLASATARDSRSRLFFRCLGQQVGRFGVGGKFRPFQDWPDECLKAEFNLRPERVVEAYNEHLPKWTGASSLDLAQRTDLRLYLLQDILIKVDRMSMLHSLEVRSPFLDYRLVELGLRIPSRLRVKNGCNKYLLRQLAVRHLPKAVCRAPKRGFRIPLFSWLAGELPPRGMRQVLGENQNGYPDPFVEGGAERLWQLAARNRRLKEDLLTALSYRWWCRAAPISHVPPL